MQLDSFTRLNAIFYKIRVAFRKTFHLIKKITRNSYFCLLFFMNSTIMIIVEGDDGWLVDENLKKNLKN